MKCAESSFSHGAGLSAEKKDNGSLWKSHVIAPPWRFTPLGPDQRGVMDRAKFHLHYTQFTGMEWPLLVKKDCRSKDIVRLLAVVPLSLEDDSDKVIPIPFILDTRASGNP